MLLLDLVPSWYVNHTLFDLAFTFTANGAEKAHLQIHLVRVKSQPFDLQGRSLSNRMTPNSATA
jgi:hypothetical protein